MSMIKRNFITVVSSPVKEKRKFNGRCILTPFINPEAGKPRPESIIEYAEDYIDTVKENASSYPCEFIKEGNPCKVYLDIDYKIEASKCSHHKGRDGLDHYVYTGNDKVNVRKEIDKIPLFKDQDFTIINRKERKIIKKDEEFVKFSYHIVFSNLYTKDVKNIKEYLKGLGYEDDKPFDLGVYNKNQGMNGLFCKKPKKEGDDDIQPLGGNDYDNYKPIEKCLITVVPDDANFVEWDKWTVKKEEIKKDKVQEEVKKVDSDDSIEKYYYDDDDLNTRIEKVKVLLTCISPDTSYTDWFDTLVCVKSILKGDECTAYDIADEWSKQCPERYDASVFGKTWIGIKDLESKGIGSLVHLAKLYDPDKLKSDFYGKFKKVLGWKDMTNLRNYKIMKEIFESRVCKIIKGGCYVEMYNDGTVSRIDKNTLINSYEHLCVETINENGKGRQEAFIKKWVKDPSIKIYQDVNMFPPPLVCPVDCYNLWTPYPISLKTDVDFDSVGECKTIEEHLLVICDKNEAIVEHFIKTIALALQKPAEKCRYIPLFCGSEGVGKNLMYESLRRLFSEEKITELNNLENELFGNFTGSWVNKKVVLLNDFNPNDLRGKNKELIKSLITETSVTVNKKFVNSSDQKQYAFFIGFTQSYDPVDNNKGSRRYLQIETQNDFIQNIEHINKMINWYSNEANIYCWYKKLMAMDLSNFNPSKLPESNLNDFVKSINVGFVVGFFQDYKEHIVKEIEYKKKTEKGYLVKCEKGEKDCITTLNHEELYKLFRGWGNLGNVRGDLWTKRKFLIELKRERREFGLEYHLDKKNSERSYWYIKDNELWGKYVGLDEEEN